MPIIEKTNRCAFLSASIDLAVGTNADTVSAFNQDSEATSRRTAWQTLIDRTLLNWLDDPSQLDDEGIVPPNGTTIRLALDFAEQFRDCGLEPAQNIVTDASGGIVIERSEADTSEVIHVWDDGQVEYQQFRGSQLVARRSY